MTRLKSTLLALSLLIASPVFAQTNVTGDWDVTVTSPQGTNTTPVTFKQEGDKVSGMFKSPQGTLPFEGGTMTGSDLKFTFTINAQGMELPITLTGKVEGETIAARPTSAASPKATGPRSVRAPRQRRLPQPRLLRTHPAPATATTAAAGVGFGGKWDVMMKTPAGDMPANATLSDDNGKLTGTFGSQLGEVPVSGTRRRQGAQAHARRADAARRDDGHHDRRPRRRQHRQRQGGSRGAGTNGMVRETHQAVGAGPRARTAGPPLQRQFCNAYLCSVL